MGRCAMNDGHDDRDRDDGDGHREPAPQVVILRQVPCIPFDQAQMHVRVHGPDLCGHGLTPRIRRK
jgi:hypothetical protein